MSAIIGIDLGTSTTEAAIYRNGKPEMIPNPDGEVITPSAVGIDAAGNWVIGEYGPTMSARNRNRISQSFLEQGMTDDEYEQYYFWEDGPTYYFLFVSDDATLYLAKASSNGQPWTELHITDPIPNYKHGDTITISVEFDGEGFIDCYANGEWMITYYDENWTGGERYGIRCEVPDVYYTDVIVDPDWVSEW